MGGKNGKRMLTTSQLKNLVSHKYSSQSMSVLDPYLQPFWDASVHLLPRWLAPNVITVAGLMINIVTSMFVIVSSGDGRNAVAESYHYVCAVGLFLYQTLDAIDGKQARRTGSQSPIGELFDHGCDAISSVFVIATVCVTLMLGDHPYLYFAFFFMGVASFYGSHWQAYVSGTLRFGQVDVTEAQIIIITMHIISYFFGTKVWLKEIALINGYSIELRMILVLIGVLSCSAMLRDVFSVILSGGQGKNGSTVAGTSTLSPAIPLILAILPAYIVASRSKEDILSTNPLLFSMAFSICVAKVTIKLVIAHMTKSPIQFFDSSMIGASVMLTNQYFDTAISEYVLIWFVVVWNSWSLSCYVVFLLREISKYLNVRLFTIAPVPAANPSSKKRFN